MAATLLLLALVAAPAEVDPSAATPAPIHNYLRGAAPRERCSEAAAAGEVVVCAPADEQARYRLDPAIPAGTEAAIRPPTVALGPGQVGIGLDQARLPGAAAPRVALRFTMPF